MTAVAALLNDGRLHLQHGPIDLIIGADGEAGEVRAAYGQARERFATILDELVAELPRLRTAVGDVFPLFSGTTARRMADAVWPHRNCFVTPMAAVAGAVADEVLDAMATNRTLRRAYVNNGGDIALHLTPGTSYRSGVVANQDDPAIDALTTVSAEQAVRGIATSGWRGRSQSLGIADSVTVLAASAAQADVAATLIANAVDADDPAIERTPANDLRDDTDLGDLPVTVSVPDTLPDETVAAALASGRARAAEILEQGLIAAALIVLHGRQVVVGGQQETRLKGVMDR